MTATDAAGNIGSGATLYVTQGIQDSVAPVISSVVLPSGTYKIGQTFTGTITADAPGYTTGSVSINGKDVTDTFVDNGNNTYSFVYTVVENDTDVLSGVPSISVVLRDTAGNTNVDYTTATGSSGDVIIDAHKPIITAIEFSSGTYAIGDVLTGTVVADSTGYTANSATINGTGVVGTFVDNGDNTYSFVYTVTEGDTDILSGEVVTASVVLSDTAGNMNSAFTGVTEVGGDVMIDATRPVMLSARTTSTGTIDVTFSENMNMLNKNDF